MQGGSSLSTCSSKELLDSLDQQAADLDFHTADGQSAESILADLYRYAGRLSISPRQQSSRSAESHAEPFFYTRSRRIRQAQHTLRVAERKQHWYWTLGDGSWCRVQTRQAFWAPVISDLQVKTQFVSSTVTSAAAHKQDDTVQCSCMPEKNMQQQASQQHLSHLTG